MSPTRLRRDQGISRPASGPDRRRHPSFTLSMTLSATQASWLEPCAALALDIRRKYKQWVTGPFTVGGVIVGEQAPR